MLKGSFDHEDFKRHKGKIHAGDLQVSIFRLDFLHFSSTIF